MKKFALLAVLALAGAAQAQTTYTDSLNELFDNGFRHLDIRSVTVNNNATHLTIQLNLDGNLNAGFGGTDWGKYGILFDTRAGGTTGASNAWGRAILTPNNQIDYWVGSWVDGSGGAQLWEYDPGNSGSAPEHGFYEKGASYSNGLITIDLSLSFLGQVTYSIDLAAMGLGIGDVVLFDVISTGGTGSLPANGDPGVDHLSRADAATNGWGEASVAGDFRAYTIIPAPGSLALLGLAGVAAGRRRR